jgi:hypothetical protein
MSIITSGTIARALFPGVKEWVGNTYKSHATTWPKVFKTGTSQRADEEIQRLIGLGLATVKPEGSPISFDAFSQGVSTRATHVVYGAGYCITKEAMEDNQYQEVSDDHAQALGASLGKTKEVVCANLFNTALTVNQSNGVPLLSSSHPIVGGVQSNRLSVATDLSLTAITDLITQMSRAVDDRGQLIQVIPKTLLIPPELVPTAAVILNSELRPGGANNDINWMQGRIKEVVSWSYLTDPDAWFILTDVLKGPTVYQRWPLEITMFTDDKTYNVMFQAQERYSVVTAEPLAVYGSEGA